MGKSWKSRGTFQEQKAGGGLWQNELSEEQVVEAGGSAAG